MTVRIGVPDDPYIPRRELETVTVELVVVVDVVATVTSVLSPSHESEARMLLRELVAGLESGALEPTAASIEPLADRIPDPPR